VIYVKRGVQTNGAMHLPECYFSAIMKLWVTIVTDHLSSFMG